MSNSKLATIKKLSPNHSGKRTMPIDRITPHCFVGQVTAQRGVDVFASPSTQASCNYVIGYDGTVGLVVDEANRSWCSSSNANDQRAVTIEVASDSTAPYAFKNAAYSKLIDLCVDICKRNGKDTLLWISNKDKALAYKPKKNEMVLTIHRWFANKSCPGDWMYARMGDLAKKVNKKLGATTTTKLEELKPANTFSPYIVKITAEVLNIRKGPGTNYAVTGTIKQNEKYTIVEENNGWGKLKSGVGWISLKYTKKA